MRAKRLDDHTLCKNLDGDFKKMFVLFSSKYRYGDDTCGSARHVISLKLIKWVLSHTAYIYTAHIHSFLCFVICTTPLLGYKHLSDSISIHSNRLLLQKSKPILFCFLEIGNFGDLLDPIFRMFVTTLFFFIVTQI